MWDLVIRGGTVADGSGSPAGRADVAIAGDRIAEVGPGVGPGRRELDAEGLLVTPGFVDPHTHYDGQATWDAQLAPSSQHGVTSAVMGNCGVGFAPVAPGGAEGLISMMEGVEDIPGTALAEGLRWDWESYPEYLDALERQPRVLDVGSQVPHAPVRSYVMGARGTDPAAVPTPDELADLYRLVRQGLEAGAVGVATSRTAVHRTNRGAPLGTLRAEAPELLALATALRDSGRGVFQLVSDAYQSADDDFVAMELDLIEAVARTGGRPLSTTVQQQLDRPERWRDLLGLAERLTAEGLDVKAQVSPRPIGVLLGLEATSNPFMACRPYARVARLPLAERVAAMADPALREKILTSYVTVTGGEGALGGLSFLGRMDNMYVLDDPVDYDLRAARSVAAEAAVAAVDPAQHLYDALVARGGRQLIYAPVFNFAGGDLSVVREMLTSPAAMYGLSDAGAHCGSICDASTTTSFLTVWGRDRPDALPIEQVVHHITRRPAMHVGWADRGLVAAGHLADLNVIDLGGLGCRPPEVVHDLPAGGRRLVQSATGYRWTVKRGSVTMDGGEMTGELPGRLVRGAQPGPVL